MHFPHLFKEIDSFIINSAPLFDDITINYSIQVTDMPLVLQTEIFESQDEAVVRFWPNAKDLLITSEMA